MKIIKVQSKADKKKFVMFPFQLYKNNKYWVPPIIKDELKLFNPATNPTLSFCDATYWIAEENGKTIGRIAAIINKNYNEKIGEKLGRFSRLEFEDIPGLGKMLLNTAEKYLIEQGMNKVHGPLGFTNLDLQGLLIEGFDQLPSIASVYHMPYYAKVIEACNYEKENDWIEFKLTVTDAVFKKVSRGASLIKKRFGFELINFKTKSEAKVYSKQILDILNDAFEELPYVSKFNDKLKKFYIDKYLNMLNPKFIKVVKKDDKAIGFFVGLPSLSKAMQKTKGKLFPFGFRHLMKALKKPESIDMLLTGVVHKYQSAGVAVILISELQEEMKKAGINTMETTGVFENNQNVITNWKSYEHVQHKRRRCYIKDLTKPE